MSYVSDSRYSNSYKSKQDTPTSKEGPEKVQKVVSGTARPKKKSELTRFADVFISEDISSVGSYLVTEVLVPSAKKLISEVITNGINMLLYGSSGKSKPQVRGAYVSYRDIAEQDGARYDIPRQRNRFNYSGIEFDNIDDARAVLREMQHIVKKYGFVTVAAMYDLADVNDAPYTANDYGWVSVANAEIILQMNGRYAIKLPKAMPLD